MLKRIEPQADGILKDGQVLGFRMQMMDGKQQVVLDANDHRPHTTVLDDAQKASAIERIRAYDERISSAWKNPEPLTADKVGSDHSRPAPLPVVIDAAALAAVQAANQVRYNERIGNAWRSPTNEGAK